MASTTSTTSSAATGLPWLPLTLLAAGVLIVAVIVVAIYRRVSRPK
jgi:predicted membrane-bound mannosyltransferase